MDFILGVIAFVSVICVIVSTNKSRHAWKSQKKEQYDSLECNNSSMNYRSYGDVPEIAKYPKAYLEFGYEINRIVNK